MRLMPESEDASARWNEVEGAIRDGCLKTCELGPNIVSMSHGPDANAQVHVTTCRAHCELALCHRRDNAGPNDRLQQALKASGEPFVTTDHFDEGPEPNTMRGIINRTDEAREPHQAPASTVVS